MCNLNRPCFVFEECGDPFWTAASGRGHTSQNISGCARAGASMWIMQRSSFKARVN